MPHGILSFLLLLCLAAPAAGAPLRLSGADGATVTLSVPAQRIVSLAPHLTDTLLALGARAQLAGVIDDREQRTGGARRSDGLALVGDAAGLNYEVVLGLRPDLILAWGSGTPRAWIERLRQLGLPVLVLEAPTLEELAGEVQMLGQATGRQTAAAGQVASLRAQLARLRALGQGVPRLRFFYQAWRQPMYSIHAGHLLSQVLALCGADNIIPAGPVAAPLVSPEFVLKANPDVLVVAAGDLAASHAWWGRFPSLAAVRDQHLLGVDDRRLTRPGPGMLSAAEPACSQISTWRKQRPANSR
ncbi:MAG: helical backbone metal receptor [Pseudomonadota bacterium]